MQNRKAFRIILAAACLIFAVVKAYDIISRDFEWIDVFFLGAFLFFGAMYLMVYLKEKKKK
ncbi:hypothetical protein ACFSKU_18030 [Pontibacter silvestris]|uniref:Uncharacterized protein n=1 Tax=Pontibacter silvestris TaxID=2305183 RepID=A0ABW4X3C8_9BACT